MAFIQFTERPHYRNPWAEFERIRQGLDELSHNFLGGEKQYSKPTVYPPLNVFEQIENITINAELPGVKTEDLNLTLEGETLTIQGERKQRNDDTLSYHRREIKNGSFSRSIALPVKIDINAMSAVLKNGVLTITLPKAEETKPRQISITTV